jgi:regulator of ribonuclease activity A
MPIITADLYDQFPNQVRLLNLELKSYGKKLSFSGEVITLKVYEDNSLVKKQLSEYGEGKVLVIDGGGSRRCALVGDNLAQLSLDNKWEGIILYGCIRDTAVINSMEVGIKALGTCPVKSRKQNTGNLGEQLIIEGSVVKPGDFIYADSDGVLMSSHILGN